MKRALSLLFVLAFLLTAHAGPRDGGFGMEIKIPGGSEERPGSHDMEKKVTFVAGQRACVIVTGSNKNISSNLSLLIHDEKGKLVASDQGAYNLVAVWYPNRDMTCTIRVLNPDSHEHLVFVSVK